MEETPPECGVTAEIASTITWPPNSSIGSPGSAASPKMSAMHTNVPKPKAYLALAWDGWSCRKSRWNRSQASKHTKPARANAINLFILSPPAKILFHGAQSEGQLTNGLDGIKRVSNYLRLGSKKQYRRVGLTSLFVISPAPAVPAPVESRGFVLATWDSRSATAGAVRQPAN